MNEEIQSTPLHRGKYTYRILVYKTPVAHKKSRFWAGGLLKCDWNFSNFGSKKPQKVDFWAKKWRFIWFLIEFSDSGGLIKSGVL